MFILDTKMARFAQFQANQNICKKSNSVTFAHPYGPLTSCKKSEKTNEPIPGAEC